MYASNTFRSTAQSVHDRPFQSSHTADWNINFISRRTVSSDTGDEIAIFPVEMRISDCCLQLPTGEMCQRLLILLQTIRSDGVKVVIDQR